MRVCKALRSNSNSFYIFECRDGLVSQPNIFRLPRDDFDETKKIGIEIELSFAWKEWKEWCLARSLAHTMNGTHDIYREGCECVGDFTFQSDEHNCYLEWTCWTARGPRWLCLTINLQIDSHRLIIVLFDRAKHHEWSGERGRQSWRLNRSGKSHTVDDNDDSIGIP